MTTRPVDQRLWGRKLKRWPDAEARVLIGKGREYTGLDHWRETLLAPKEDA